jgi:uncharacterized membrane protein YfcA
MNPIPLVIVGLFVGLMGGMFGFGGSSISTPLLRVFFSIPPYYALASPLPMTLLSSAIATKRYYQEGFIEWDTVKKMLFVIIPGSFIGAYSTKYIDGRMLMLLTAIFLIYVAVRFIFTLDVGKMVETRRGIILFAGFLIGFLSGMLANGGGILIVPILMFLGLNIKRAIGTSMALVFFVAIPSFLVHWYLGHIDWLITLALSAGALPGAYLGAWITVKIDRRKLRRMYGIFLLLFAIYFAIFELLGIG